MAEPNNVNSKKPLSLARPGRLELKKTVDAGSVKQSFSHGRTKQVSVEVKKKRTFTRGESAGEMTEAAGVEASPFAPSMQTESGRDAHHGLSNVERQQRIRALEGAQSRLQEPHHPPIAPPTGPILDVLTETADTVEAISPPPPPVEAPKAPLEVAPIAPVQPEPPPIKTEPAPAAESQPLSRAATTASDDIARDQAQSAEGVRRDEHARQLAAQHVRARLTVKVDVPSTARETVPSEVIPVEGEEDDEERGKRGRTDGKKTPPKEAKGRNEPRRRTGKLTINQALDEGEGLERVRSLAAFKRAREREKQKARLEQQLKERKKVSREIVLPESITVQELAGRMAEKGADVVKVLFKMGVMATINQMIDADTAELVATELGHRVRRVANPMSKSESAAMWTIKRSSPRVRRS